MSKHSTPQAPIKVVAAPKFMAERPLDMPLLDEAPPGEHKVKSRMYTVKTIPHADRDSVAKE